LNNKKATMECKNEVQKLSGSAMEGRINFSKLLSAEPTISGIN
jgi:hypothetical protein